MRLLTVAVPLAARLKPRRFKTKVRSKCLSSFQDTPDSNLRTALESNIRARAVLPTFQSYRPRIMVKYFSQAVLGTLVVAFTLFVLTPRAHAQDNYEIQVYS